VGSHVSGTKINALAWSHNNQIIASGGEDGQVVLSLALTGKKLHTIQANLTESLSGGPKYVAENSPVSSIVFSKSSEFLCAGMGEGSAKIWNLQQKKLVANLI